eukprot:GHVS01100941.1.p1 GENE.GHVS01100941.1~~GHVS01100941.1.p1  ORF type:complete len:380 (+),score=33.27 GHVS01100941.1:250-1389(+)
MVPISFAARCLLVALATLLVSAVQAELAKEDVHKFSDAMQLIGKTAKYFKKIGPEQLETSTSGMLNFAWADAQTFGHVKDVLVSQNKPTIDDRLKSVPIAFDYKPAEGAALHILTLRTLNHSYAIAFNDDDGDSKGVFYDYAILTTEGMADELGKKWGLTLPESARVFVERKGRVEGEIEGKEGKSCGGLFLLRCEWRRKNGSMIIAFSEAHKFAAGVSEVKVLDSGNSLTLDLKETKCTGSDWNVRIDTQNGGSWALTGFAAHYAAVKKLVGLKKHHVDSMMHGFGKGPTGSTDQKLWFDDSKGELVVHLEEMSADLVTDIIPFNVKSSVAVTTPKGVFTVYIYLEPHAATESEALILYSYDDVGAVYKFERFSKRGS